MIDKKLEQRDEVLSEEPLAEGRDFYIEGGLMVFTALFLERRGYCCESGCRHCPYGYADGEKG
ncbi:MAG: DUF5522 domain-containing protein [bacterium]